MNLSSVMTRGGARRCARLGVVAMLSLLCALSAVEARADDVPDTVIMTNGGRLRGTVMEEDPQKGTSIKLIDGTVRRLSPGEVKRVVYAGTGHAAIAPAPGPGLATTSPGVAVAPTVGVPAAVQVTPGVLPSLDDRFSSGREGRAGKALWVASLVTWATAYATTVGVAVGVCAGTGGSYWAPVGEAFVPFAGPWIIMADKKTDVTADGGRTAGTAILGVLQDAALVGFIVGVGIDSGRREPRTATSRWILLPTVGPSYAGLTFSAAAL